MCQWVIVVQSKFVQLYHGEREKTFQWDDVRFVLDQHVWLDFYSASSLKLQSADSMLFRSLRYIIPNPRQPIFALTPQFCVISGKQQIPVLLVFGLIWPGLEPTIYRTRGEHVNYYTIDAVKIIRLIWFFGVLTPLSAIFQLYHGD